MMFWIAFFLLFLGFLVARSYLHQSRIKRHFLRYGIKSTSSLPIFGRVIYMIRTGGMTGSLRRSLEAHEELGETYIAWLFDHPTIETCNPEFIRHVLGPKYTNYDRAPLEIKNFDDIFGGGLVFQPNGNKWRIHRQLLTNGFHQTRLSEAVEDVGRRTLKFLSTIKEKDFFDIQQAFQALTFDVMCFFALGIELEENSFQGQSLSEVWYDLLEHTASRIIAPFPYWKFIQTKGVKKFNSQLNFLKGIVNKAIDKELQTVRENQDPETKTRRSLLSFMVSHHLQDPSMFSHQDIMEEALTFLFAGHDTTTNLLTFMLYHIGQSEDIRAKCLEEVDSFFSSRPLDSIPTQSELKQLRYLKMVTKETLRLYPGAPLRTRFVLEDDEFKGIPLPAKSSIVVDFLSCHLNPENWPDPHKFDPERFTEEKEAQRPAHHWVPFGAGARRCIGEQLALLEALCVTVMILRRYEPVSDPSKKPSIILKLTMGAKDGVFVAFQKRGEKKSF